jgi:hypothetical protein
VNESSVSHTGGSARSSMRMKKTSLPFPVHISSLLFLYEIWVGDGAESGSGVVVAGWVDGAGDGVPLVVEGVAVEVEVVVEDEEEEVAVKGLNSKRHAPLSRLYAERVLLLAAMRKGNSSGRRESTMVCLRCP